MFDFGFSELLLIGVVALVVLGPERLPQAARAAGRLAGRVQRTVGSVKQELGAHLEMEELRQAKSELEAAAESLRGGLGSAGERLRQELDGISDGLNVPAWERVPQQRTPADFGLDEYGKPLAGRDESRIFSDGLMPSENLYPPADAAGGFHTLSLRRQAMQRKRDMRPRRRSKPQLRVRKK